MKEHQDLIRLERVNLRFGRNHVLQNISMALHRGCITTLIGPNGAGKTTLVKVVLGLTRHSDGEVWRAPGLRVGYMPQKLHVDKTFPLTVKRFLQTAQCRELPRMEQALDRVNARKLLHESIHNLSGGEMQRVLLARALLRNPNLLVLDEPVQGVDISGQLELYSLIGELRDQLNCGVLMISHDLHLVMSATDHVICMNRHICCSGNPEHVSNDPSFTDLFGARGAEQLALYNHRHNHRHNVHGDIVPDTCEHHHHG
jgi:zinc transport system ATP-binding protein